MEIKNKSFLIIGHPRCGTGYSAKLLQSYGYDVGHEEVLKDGISSWFFVQDNDGLWIKEKRCHFNFKYIIHNIRDPFDAIESIALSETPRKGIIHKPGVYTAYNYRKKYVNIDENANFMVRAVQSFLGWNELIESQKIDFTLKVEHGENIEYFFKEKNIPYKNNNNTKPNKKYNSRKHRKLQYEDWALLPQSLINKLDEFCNKYGYPLLSKRIDMLKNKVLIRHQQKDFIIDVHSDHIGRIIKNNKSFYELPLLKHIQKNVKYGGIYIDIGANIGNHSLFFSKFCGEKVYAIEPVPENYELLKNNINNNNIDNIIAINAGISLLNTKMGYSKVQDNMGMCNLIPNEAGEISTFSFNNFLEEKSIDKEKVKLIKIDAEAMSKEIFDSCLPFISKYRPHLIIEADGEELKYILSKISYKIIGKFNATPTYHLRPK